MQHHLSSLSLCVCVHSVGLVSLTGGGVRGGEAGGQPSEVITVPALHTMINSTAESLSTCHIGRGSLLPNAVLLSRGCVAMVTCLCVCLC